MRCKDENECLTGTDLGGISKPWSVSVNYLSICLEKLRRKVMKDTGQDKQNITAECYFRSRGILLQNCCAKQHCHCIIR
jgi:hypothetical protein